MTMTLQSSTKQKIGALNSWKIAPWMVESAGSELLLQGVHAAYCWHKPGTLPKELSLANKQVDGFFYLFMYLIYKSRFSTLSAEASGWKARFDRRILEKFVSHLIASAIVGT